MVTRLRRARRGLHATAATFAETATSTTSMMHAMSPGRACSVTDLVSLHFASKLDQKEHESAAESEAEAEAVA